MRVALLCLSLGIAISGCGSVGSSYTALPSALAQRPVTYTVVSGDTIYRIATRYHLSVGRLMTANGIADPRDLRVGQVLTIPGQYQAASLAGSDTALRNRHRSERDPRQFNWPVDGGVVSSGFGIRDGSMHDGVDISAPAGTPVHAADKGIVIFSGSIHGYGNTVIIRHDDHYCTVYGHNQVNLVREGERVVSGQEIAEIGRTGRTTGSNLHFEVRRDNVARDPLACLPELPPSSGVTFAASGGS